MKKYVETIFILATALLLNGCKTDKKEITVIDLDNISLSEDLKISQLAENLRYIPLETNETTLLPDWARIDMTENNIIVCTQQSILLFSPEGKYLRKLASSGKGPEEFQAITASVTDEANHIFYYAQTGPVKCITMRDIKTGKLLGQIPIKTNDPLKTIILSGKSLIFFTYLIRLGEGCNNIIYKIDRSGEISDMIAHLTKAMDIDYAQNIHTKDNIIYEKNDTIFQLRFPIPQPMAILKYANKRGNTTEGIDQAVIMDTPEAIFIQKMEINVKTTTGVVNYDAEKRHLLKFDKKTGKTVEIDKFYIDPLEITIEIPKYILISGNRLAIRLEAFKIKELAKEKRERGETLSPALQSLDRQLTEESNPVLVIGDLK